MPGVFEPRDATGCGEESSSRARPHAGKAHDDSRSGMRERTRLESPRRPFEAGVGLEDLRSHVGDERGGGLRARQDGLARPRGGKRLLVYCVV